MIGQRIWKWLVGDWWWLEVIGGDWRWLGMICEEKDMLCALGITEKDENASILGDQNKKPKPGWSEPYIILRAEKQHAPSRILRGGAFSRILRDNGRIVKRTFERVTTSKYARRRQTEEELKGERGTHIKDNRTNYRACRFVMQSSYFFTWGGLLEWRNGDDNAYWYAIRMQAHVTNTWRDHS